MLNKNERAKLAKDTINNFIPKILNSNPQAKDGAKKAELIYYLPDVSKALPSSINDDKSSKAVEGDQKVEVAEIQVSDVAPTPPKIKVIQSDTFDAANTLISTLPPHSKSRVGVLNM